MGVLKYKILKFSLFLLLLQSMYVWFLWGQQILLLLLTLFSILFFSLVSKESFSIQQSKIVTFLFLSFLLIYTSRDLNIHGYIATFLRVFIYFFIICLDDNVKAEIFNFFTKALAIVLLISSTVWAFFLCGIPLPHSYVSFNDGQYIFYNYYFFLLDARPISNLIPRFSSIFLEPGHLGMFAAFFLYANRFNLRKKEVLIIFIISLLTFSLAAYVLLIFSVLIYILLKSSQPKLNFFLFVIFLLFFYFYFSTLNNGENIINKLILERLQVDDGKLVGNNRFTVDFDAFYNNLVTSIQGIFGIGTVKYNQLFWSGGNAGYKVFIAQYGIVGVFFLFLFYFSIVNCNWNKLTIMFFIVYVFSFLQRAYALWDVELLIFITAVPLLSINKKYDFHDETS